MTLLRLVATAARQVLVLRRQMLRLVHCKEFSPEAEFKVRAVPVLFCRPASVWRQWGAQAGAGADWCCHPVRSPASPLPAVAAAPTGPVPNPGAARRHLRRLPGLPGPGPVPGPRGALRLLRLMGACCARYACWSLGAIVPGAPPPALGAPSACRPCRPADSGARLALQRLRHRARRGGDRGAAVRRTAAGGGGQGPGRGGEARRQAAWQGGRRGNVAASLAAPPFLLLCPRPRPACPAGCRWVPSAGPALRQVRQRGQQPPAVQLRRVRRAPQGHAAAGGWAAGLGAGRCRAHAVRGQCEIQPTRLPPSPPPCRPLPARVSRCCAT